MVTVIFESIMMKARSSEILSEMAGSGKPMYKQVVRHCQTSWVKKNQKRSENINVAHNTFVSTRSALSKRDLN